MEKLLQQQRRSFCVHDHLMARMRRGDCQALSTLFSRHWPQLERLVASRMNRRLSGRMDASDVLQEAYVNAERRLGNFTRSPTNSFLVWMSLIIQQTLIDLTRRHIVATKRSVSKEIEFHQTSPSGCVRGLSWIIARTETPSENVAAKESRDQLIGAMRRLSLVDQQVIYLRHFEDLSNQVVADKLGMTPKNASIRYVRALAKLKRILESQSLG